MEELVRLLVGGALLFFIPFAHGQYMQVFTRRRTGELLPTSSHYHGSLFLPVDGRNATLDCWNYDRNPVQCAKIPHCNYHCHSGHCKDNNKRDTKACSQYCLNVCGCKQAGCFDYLGVNCRPTPACPFEAPEPKKKGPPMTLRRSNKFPFNICPDAVNLQRLSPKRGDFEYVPVIAVNLGGERHVDEMGWIFEADSEVLFDDPDGLKEIGTLPDEEVIGVSDADKPLYGTYVKGKGGEPGEDGKPKCLNYMASLCEEGNYILDLKIMEPEYEEAGYRLFDVRINDVVIIDELDIVGWTKRKGRAAEILVRFFFGAGDAAISVAGERANVTNGEIKISFCASDCPNVTDGGFAVSAFQVLHWQRTVNVYGTSISHRGDECRCRIMAGKEYNYETSMCTTARECTPCSVKSICMRADAVYVSGGSACRNRFARGSCIIEEIVNAVNINGRAHQDSRGIRYVGDDDSLFDDRFKLRYDLDGDILSYGSCPVDPWTRTVVTGVVASDAILYETFTRSLSSGSKGMCMTYNISETVKTDGKYELVVKTVEPFYENPGSRSFSIRIFYDEEENDRPVVPDFDILRFSDPCEATDVIINFEVTDGGASVTLQGHEPRELTDARMNVGFCLSSCSANVSKAMFQYDSDFIVSAFYIARIADKPEPHIEAAKEKMKPGDGGDGGGEVDSRSGKKGGNKGGGGGEGKKDKAEKGAQKTTEKPDKEGGTKEPKATKGATTKAAKGKS